MNGFIKRGLLTVLVTGGFLALGAGVAYADDTTDGSDGTGSGSQALLGINLPITVGGNGISVLGDSSSSGSSNTGSTGGSSPSAWTSGTDSLLGGSQGVVDANVPVTISGNAISVLGDSSSEGSSFEGESGSGDAGYASTSGKDGIAGGTQIVGDVNAPITVSGNAISVAGDSFSGQSGTVSSSDSDASGSSGWTSGDDSVAGGSQVLADAGVPVVVGGNAISVIGDSSSEGSTVSNGSGNGSGAGNTAVTDGSDGTLGGSQVVADAAAPVTAGGNAISVIGDSSSEGSTFAGESGTGEAGYASTSGTDSVAGGSQVLADAGVPVVVGGNAISAIGDSSSEGSTFSNGSGSGSGTGNTAVTDGSDGTLSGSQVVADAAAPVTAGGNAISVIGDSSSEGSTFAGESGTGEAGYASTSGTDSVAGGTQVLADAGAPVLVGGNAISAIGDSSTEGSTFSNGSGSGSGTGNTAVTDGSDGIVGGSQVVADAAAPVTAGGNALSVIGDSSSSGSDVSSPSNGGSPAAFTSGEDGIVGGTQLVTGVNAPITLGNNAVSVIGDSTVEDGTDGDDGDVGGETVTPPDTTPDGLALAGVGAVTLLAATGSDLLVPGLALALLLLAAGVAFRIRPRTARS